MHMYQETAERIRADLEKIYGPRIFDIDIDSFKRLPDDGVAAIASFRLIDEAMLDEVDEPRQAFNFSKPVRRRFLLKGSPLSVEEMLDVTYEEHVEV